jgi:hypothetical protein
VAGAFFAHPVETIFRPFAACFGPRVSKSTFGGTGVSDCSVPGSARAPKVALIAVWDENAVGDAKGGTAHMVQIARAAGNIDVRLIKLKDGAILAANR